MEREILNIRQYVDGTEKDPSFLGLRIEEYTYSASRMGFPYITANVYSVNDILDEWKTDMTLYVTLFGSQFFLREAPTSGISTDDGRFKYEVAFRSPIEIFNDVYFYDVVKDWSLTVNKPCTNSTTFSFYGNIREFVDRLNTSFLYAGIGDSILNKKTDLTTDNTPAGDGFCAMLDNDTDFDYDESFEMSFEDYTIWQAIQEAYSESEVLFRFYGKKVIFGSKSAVVSHVFRYKGGDALLGVTKTNADAKVINRITFKGSSDNIPYYYPNDSEYGNIELSNDKVSILNAKTLVNSLTEGVDVTAKEVLVGNASIDESRLWVGGYFKDDTKLTLGEEVWFSHAGSVMLLRIGLIISEDCDYTINKISAHFRGLVSGDEQDANMLIFQDYNVAWKDKYYFELYNYDGDVVSKPTLNSDNKLYLGRLAAGVYMLYVYTVSPAYKYVETGQDGVETVYDDDIYFTLNSVDATFEQHYETRYVAGETEKDALSGYGLYGTLPIGESVHFTIVSRLPFQEYLMPPIYRETAGAERFYNAKNDTYTDPDTGKYYEFVNEFVKEHPCEHIFEDEDIMPTIDGITNSKGQLFGEIADIAYDDDDDDSLVADSDDETDSANYKHSYFYIKLHIFDGDYGFSLFDAASQTDKMTLQITSGNCNGCKFEVGGIEETSSDGTYYYKNPVQVKEADGDIVDGTYADKVKENSFQSFQQDTTQNSVWIAVQKDVNTFGVIMPNATNNYKPQIGDTFNIININMPTAYILAAERRGMEEAIRFMADNNEEQYTFSVELSRIFFQHHKNVLAELNEYSKLQVEYAGKTAELYVTSFTYTCKESEPLPEIAVELSDTVSVGESFVKNVADRVESIISNDITKSGASKSTLMSGTDTTITDQRYLRKDVADTAAEKIVFNKGLEVGQFESGTSGGYWGIDTSNNKTTIETDNLYVRYKAFFESLEVVNVASLGGKMILTAGGSAKLSYAVKHGEETILAKMLLEDRGLLKTEGWGDIILEQLEELEPIPEGVWRCFFLAEQDGQEVENRFEAGDQIISKDFNITKPGEYNQVTNHYYWRLCVNKSTNVVTLADLGYHWVDLSMSDCDTGSVDPCKGDVIAQLGNRIDGNKERQNAIVMTSVDDFAPQICLYSGITSFSLNERNMVDIGVDDDEQAFLKVFGKFYVGTRPKYNEDGSVDETDETYVRFQDGKVTVKAKIEATSTVGDKTLENYVNGISDEKAQEVQDALDENVKTINASLSTTNTTVSGLKNFTDSAFADGIVDRSEAQTIIGYLKTIETSFQDAQNSYEEIKGNQFLGSEEKKALETAYTNFSTAKNELVDEINKVVEKGLVDDDDRSNVSQKYTNFNDKFGTFKNKLNAAVNAITVALNDKITELGVDITKLDYIKKALAESTTFTGGLVLSTLISLGYDNTDFSTQTSWAGLSGAYDTTKIGNGIAFWAGGDMIDKFDYYDYDKGTFNVPEGKRVAASLDRMDGTGYRANGNLWWDASGNVHADPLSFFVGPTQVGKLLAAFNVTDDTIYPQLPFGDTSFQGVDGIRVGDGYLKWDSERNALYVVGKDKDGNEQAINFYTHGEVIAGGGDSDDDGGGNVSFNLLTSWTQDYDSTTYALGAALAIELHNSLNTLSTKVENIETNMGVGVSVNNGQVVTPNDKGVINLTIDEYTPTAATSGALGCIKIGYTTSATDRKYAVELDSSSNKAFVKVPWTDTVYTLSTASASTLGGIKIGFSESNKDYAVKLDSNNKAYVHVGWTDTTYTSLKNPYSLKFDGDSAKSYDGSSEVKVTAAMVGALASDGKAKSAGTADSATTAGQLTNSHTFWGQSFNGTQDVSGALSSVTTISASGNITTSGEVTAGSDIRYKDVQHDCSLPLPFIAAAPLFNFKWKGERDDGREHIGTSAQYWQEYAPEFVSGDEDFLRLNYGALGVAMGISNARAIQSVHEQMMELAKSLQRLTEENKRLSEELEYIKKGGQQ
jgi:Ni,Fe-hydrogenase III small subunit